MLVVCLDVRDLLGLVTMWSQSIGLQGAKSCGLRTKSCLSRIAFSFARMISTSFLSPSCVVLDELTKHIVTNTLEYPDVDDT